VQSLYTNILGRTPTSTEVTNSVNDLLSGYEQQRLAVLNSIFFEPVHFEYKRTSSASTISLPATRSAGEQVAQRSRQQLRHSRTRTGAARDRRAANPEYRDGTEYFNSPLVLGSGAGNNSAWLSQIFLDLLNRNVNATEQQFFLNSTDPNFQGLNIAKNNPAAQLAARYGWQPRS